MRLVILLFLALLPTTTMAQERKPFGWVEKVRITPGNILVHAKLDTGADTSSLDASDIIEFTKDKEDWVRFSLTNRYGDKVLIERPIRRIAMVKRHRGKHQKRKVIRIGVCLGNKYMETDVSLIDRTNFDYQMLIGRNFLAGNVLVDSAVTHTSLPSCEEKK